jgi:hypothetical protein
LPSPGSNLSVRAQRFLGHHGSEQAQGKTAPFRSEAVKNSPLW